MGSEALAVYATANIWADPYFWTTLVAVFFGFASGQALRVFIRLKENRVVARRRRSRRIARAIAFLSIGILAFAALLVLADKAALVGGIARFLAIPSWVAFVAVVGMAAGFRPFVLGTPLAALALSVLGLVGLCLDGWLPLRAAGSSFEIARLLPYEVGPNGFSGHFELPERDSVPVAQELGLPSNSVSLRVESLELAGPLRLAVGLLKVVSAGERVRSSDASASFSTVARFYRIVGLASPGGDMRFASPRHIALLDTLLSLPPNGGLEPGAMVRSTLFGLATRFRRTSGAERLVTLEPVSFGISADGSALTVH
jgi:hypothetical protein